MPYRSLDCGTWDDPWFADLAPNAKLLFLYLITNRRVSQCGSMEITVRQIAFETGLHGAEIPNIIEQLGDRVKWWPDHSLLIVRNFYKRQRANTGDKFDLAAQKSAELLPDFARSWVYGVYPHLAPSGYTHPIPTPVPPHTHAISEAEAGDTAGAGALAGDTPLPPDGGTPSEPKQRPPTTSTPFLLLESLCEAIGTDVSALGKRDKDKQLGIAKRLADDGATPDDIRHVTKWLQSQKWVQSGVDMGLIEKQIGKWRLNGKPQPQLDEAERIYQAFMNGAAAPPRMDTR